jgi:hypothetical protein
MDRHSVMAGCYQIPGMLWPSEQSWLYDNLGFSKSHCEVGVYAGRSLFATAHGMRKPGTILAVDSFVGAGEMGQEWMMTIAEATIKQIHANTHVKITLDKRGSIDVARTNKIEFDSVWIDACHHYAECKADIEAWSHFVRPGGIVCGHDYWACDAGVMNAVNETGPFSVAEGTRIWWRKV